MTGLRLTAHDVAVRYGAVRALDGVSLEAAPGEVVALLGPSGAGKSTLLRVLHLLERPQAGLVAVDGARVPHEPEARLATLRRMALVQQRPGFLRATALENVEFPLRARGVPRRAARVRARLALERVGMLARADAAAATLSGGEAQRVATARALVTEPAALLLDEFTNQLDPENEDLVEGVVLDERRRGATVVVVTHSVAQARRLADRVAFMEEGRVVEAGETRRVLDEPEHDVVRRFVERA